MFTMTFGFNVGASAPRRLPRGPTNGHGGNRRRRLQKKLSIERLEPRVVLAGDVVIAEFLAENTNGLFDEDDDHVDWLEIYNNSGAALDLGGWHITNDVGDLAKWTLPAGATVGANEFLLVFASGKDRAIAAGELPAASISASPAISPAKLPEPMITCARSISR